jgi:antitoxin ChpS
MEHLSMVFAPNGVMSNKIYQLHLQAGATVGMTVSGGHLVIDPKPRPRYTLAELLAASDYSQPQSAEEREWVDAPAVGGELTSKIRSTKFPKKIFIRKAF